MKIDTCTAAKELHMHPAELIVKLWNYKLIYTLADCWPQLERDLIERLSQTEGIPQHHHATMVLHTNQGELQKEIIRKMHTHTCWGHNRIGIDQLKKFLPHDVDFRSLPKALKELCNQGLIQKKNNSYSLNNNKKADIDHYINH